MAPLLLLMGTLVAFADGLLPGRGLLYRDHSLVFRPRWWGVNQAFESWTLPVMTRASPGGVPLEVQLNGTYTPLTALFALFDFELAYDLFVVGHVVLLTAGAYLLARHFDASRSEAMFASAVAGLAGPVVSLENLLVMLQGLAWAPWMYLAFHRLLQRQTPGAVGAVALAIGFHVQGIMPSLALMDVVVAVVLLAHAKPAPSGRLLASLIGGAVLGISVGAIELMPVLEALGNTRRGAGFSYAERAVWSVRAGHVIDAIVPGFWALPDQPHLFFESMNSGKVTAYLSSLYVGFAPGLCLLALADRAHRRWSITWTALIAMALIVAMGDATPVHRMVTSLPILQSSRYPVKFTVVAVTFAAALAPLGLRVAAARPRLASVVLAAHAVVLLIGLGVLSMPEVEAYLGTIVSSSPHIYPVAGVKPAAYPALAVAAMQPRVLHAAMFAAGAAVVVIACHGSRRQALIAPLVATLLLADLALGARFTVFGAPEVPTSMPEAILERLASDRDLVMPLAPGARYPALKTLPDDTPLATLISSDRIRGYRVYRRIRLLDDRDADGMSHPASRITMRLLGRSTRARANRVMARAGAAWVSSWLKDSGVDATRFEIPDQPPHYVWPVPDVRPYVHAYDRWQAIDLGRMNLDQALELYAGDATWHTALVLAPVATSTIGCSRPPVATLRDGATDTRYELHIQADCDAFVVLREIAVDGWHVLVDGAPATLAPAEFGMLGVRVPAGAETVVFEYASRMRRWVWLSALSTTVAGLLIGVGAVRRERLA